MSIKACYGLLPALLVAACGGGGDGGGGTTSQPPPPTVFSGQFKDGNTAGLTYSTTSQSGTTDALGTFRYRNGEIVEFSVGGVVLGSAPGATIMTPVDLVTGGSASHTEVRNIVRFLLMLDRNGDPSDGIEISPAVRDIAVNWTPVDFTAGDLGAELVSILSDVASVDSRTPTLPGSAEAEAHLEQTIYCLMSGFFIGNFAGPSTDTVVFLIDPVSGIVKAASRDIPDDLVSTIPVGTDAARTFTLLADAGGNDTIDGRFDTLDDLSGTWNIGQQSGTFSATRVMPDLTATYRFTGQWFKDLVKPSIEGPLVLNIDASGVIAGEGYDLATGNTYRNSGTLSGQNLSIDWEAGASGSGTMDSGLYVSGSGINPSGAARPWFAQGCQLN